MTLWFNPGRDGNPNMLGGKMGETNAELLFDEAVYRVDSSGNFGTLLANFTAWKDVKRSGGETPELGVATLKFTIKEYEKEYQGKKDKKVPTPRELFFHEQFLKFGDDAFAGKISLAVPDPILAGIADGSLPEASQAAIIPSYFAVQKTFEGEPEKVKPYIAKLGETTSFRSGKGYAGENTATKIEARLSATRKLLSLTEDDGLFAIHVAISELDQGTKPSPTDLLKVLLG